MNEPADVEPFHQGASLGIVLAIVGTFLFALKSIFIKLAFAAEATPTEVLVLRMMFSLPFYVGMLIYLSRQTGQEAPTYRQVALAMLLGFLGYYLASWLDLKGLDYISAQLERLTLFTYPAMISLLAWMFLGELLTKRILISIALCYAGVFVMYRGEQMLELNEQTTVGVLLVVGSALSYSLYVLFAKRSMEKIGSRRFTSLAMIGSTVFISIHFAVSHSTITITRLDGSVYLYAVILAIACTVIPSFLINEAILRIGATRATLIGSLGPVLTMILAIVVLKEPSSDQHFMGMAMVLGGVGLVARR